MTEAEFSWLKIASFFGAAVLLVVCFVAIATVSTQYAPTTPFMG